MLHVLDRGPTCLQAPRGESGSYCGFSAGFAGLRIHDSRRRSRGNVGNPAGIFHEMLIGTHRLSLSALAILHNLRALSPTPEGEEVRE
jgi:hypothetical protein